MKPMLPPPYKLSHQIDLLISSDVGEGIFDYFALFGRNHEKAMLFSRFNLE